jgi:NAD(P)H-quinone oxidoreductase subunit 5
VSIWGQPIQNLSWTWLKAAGLSIPFELEISPVNVGALIVITGLNLAAQIYAIGYLEMDWGWARFFSLMALFEAGMCTLVLCNSLFFTYVVLEILTLGTYLLIGFWFNQSLVVTGARDAFLTKRVGDLILLMGVVALLPLAKTWNFDELAQWASTAHVSPLTANLICLALIAGPVAKCAQLPLHLWLDEAMEGPMPASIIRNALVVATGAWVLIKLEPVFILSPLANAVMIAIGLTTALGASLIAIAQIDLKRCLSYSVSAYMGLMLIAVGTGQGETALKLLLVYAIAMAILVMSIGGIILTNVSQDITQYGGLWSRRPITGICFLVGACSLVALPPFGGFWILSQIISYQWVNHPLIALGIITVEALTAFSLTREFCSLFGGQIKAFTVRSLEGLWALILPMTVVTGLALHLPMLFATWGFIAPWESLNIPAVVTLVGATVLGIVSAAYLYLNEQIPKPIKFPAPALQDFFANDLYTAQFYKVTIVALVGVVSQVVNWFDRFIVDGIVNLVGLATVFGGQTLKYNVSGQTQFYAFSILLGVALFILVLCWPLLNHIFF